MIKDNIDMSRYDSHRSESTAPIINGGSESKNNNVHNNHNESMLFNSS